MVTSRVLQNKLYQPEHSDKVGSLAASPAQNICPNQKQRQEKCSI